MLHKLPIFSILFQSKGKYALDNLVEEAFDDQCTGTNPRYPFISEIKQLYTNAYYGENKVV